MTQHASIQISRAAREDLSAVVDLFMMVEAQHEAYWPLRWKTKPNIREGFLRWMTNNVDNDGMLIAVARDPSAATEPAIPLSTFNAQTPAHIGGRVPNPTKVAGAIVIGVMDEIPIYTYKNYAYVHDLAVALDYRRRGIGTLLLNFARDWSVEKGLPQLRLMVADANGDAAAAFGKLGFRTTYHEMVLPLKNG
jgi:ribosomal protein S18 acetylase RimI-like enzyme